MAKVRTFSRVFPKNHINEGKPTFFVEKILNGFGINYSSEEYFEKLLLLNTINISKGKLSFEDIESFHLSLQNINETKFHTIRGGFSVRTGDKISPRVWFGKPYNTPQIVFWDDIEVQSVQDFYNTQDNHWLVDKSVLSEDERLKLSIGDGLSYEDMISWFKMELHGQVICWKENLLY